MRPSGPRRSLPFLAAVTSVAAALSSAAPSRAELPVAEHAPALSGEQGVVHIVSARPGRHLQMDIGVAGGFAYAPDGLVENATDANALLKSNMSAAVSFLDLVQVFVQTQAGANLNSALPGGQFSVGDLTPGVKVGYAFLPVAVGLDVRAHLPTRPNAPGFDFAGTGVEAKALVTLDLYEKMKLPVRAHLNAGYVFQAGKGLQGEGGRFEQNRFFMHGDDGLLLALASEQWFYDQLIAGLAVEAPFPIATPFVEVQFQSAVGVPENRGVAGAAYSMGTDAHLTLTPGVRLAPLPGLLVDLSADVGILGTGGAGAGPSTLVAGQPPNPGWLLRFGVSHSFDPLQRSAPSIGGGGGGGGQQKVCVNDEGGRPVSGAVIEGEALSGVRLAADASGCVVTPLLPAGENTVSVTHPDFEAATVQLNVVAAETGNAQATLKRRAMVGTGGGGAGGTIAGYVTTREDEVLDVALELTDGTGPHSVGKTQDGAFSIESGSGRVMLTAVADGYLAQGAELFVEPGRKTNHNFVMRKVPKKRAATLEKTKIAVAARVPFEFKKPRLQSAAEYVLDEVVDVLLRNAALRVRIDAYTEALATDDESAKLANARAEYVADYLVAHGVQRTRLETKGNPLGSGTSEKNRRVEFTLLP